MLSNFSKGILSALGVLFLLTSITLIKFDSWAKSYIEQYLTERTGFPTKIDSLNLRLRDGAFYLKGIEISNPPHFKYSKFLDISQLKLTVSYPSLLKDKKYFPECVIDIQTFTGVRNSSGKINILEFSNAFKKQEKKTREPIVKREGDDEHFIVDRLLFRLNRVKIIDNSGSSPLKQSTQVNYTKVFNNVTKVSDVTKVTARDLSSSVAFFAIDSILKTTLDPETYLRFSERMLHLEEVIDQGKKTTEHFLDFLFEKKN